MQVSRFLDVEFCLEDCNIEDDGMVEEDLVARLELLSSWGNGVLDGARETF